MSGLVLSINGQLIRQGNQILSGVLGTVSSGGQTPASGATLTVSRYFVGNTLAKPVFQRKAGTESNADGGYADVPILFTHSGYGSAGPSTVQARVVSATTGAVIKDWTDLTDVQFDSTTGVGTLPGVPVGAEYTTLLRDKLQPNNAATNANSTQRWGVGVCLLLAGQSNMIGTLDIVFNTPIAGTSRTEYDNWLDPSFAGSVWAVNSWTAPYGLSGNTGAYSNGSGNQSTTAGGIGMFLRLVGAGLATKYGKKVPICIIPWMFSGTGLQAMTPPAGTRSQLYLNSGITGAEDIGFKSPKGYGPGDFEGVLMHQGENANSQPRADRVTEQKAYYQALLDVVAPFGRTAATLWFRPAVLGAYQVNGYENIENVRAATYDLEQQAPALGWPRVKAGWNCIDIDAADSTPDGLHFIDVAGGNQYRKWSLKRAAQTALYELGCATFDGMGPKISSVTRSGLVVTIKVAHQGGANLVARNSGAAPTGFVSRVPSQSFNGALITPTVAIAGPDTVTMTYPSGTSFPIEFKYMGDTLGTTGSMHPNLTNPLYDDAAYPTSENQGGKFPGIALQATPDKITVN